jgi:TRAP-type mannitol/chloroaromatic compound transport system substrate-binding protein
MDKYNKENCNGTAHQRNDFKLYDESRSENDKARTREQASERRDIEREEAFRATSNSLREQAERRQGSSIKRFKRNVEQFRSTSNPLGRIIERVREINNSIKIKKKKKNPKNDQGYLM